ncbi:hypothetical protein DHEL01_v205461 [Diaporthe helianthi]|uniref:Uncharacterized protein n=1 Tax=Diaporthe helianthi TaxID=158607 RepID=A0A2P5I0U5_DIAHE|nr:hypothetical protein DHEL01_v205461 [Diaporthe helianthi]
MGNRFTARKNPSSNRANQVRRRIVRWSAPLWFWVLTAQKRPNDRAVSKASGLTAKDRRFREVGMAEPSRAVHAVLGRKRSGLVSQGGGGMAGRQWEIN